MNKLQESELEAVSGGAIIILIGGAFLGGVLAGYVQKTTEQYLDSLDDPEPDTLPTSG